MVNKRGKVWLVGAGPGDSGLLTIKAKQIIEECDVIVYDKLVGQGVLGMIPRGKKNIFVGKVSGNHAVPQSEINKILLNEALDGKNVCRLKGGDPFLFGRGGEELELLIENDIDFEIVPGITSAIAVPAYNGIPVTHRDFVNSLHIITGHTKSSEEAEVDYEALVRLGGTFVFLMGLSALPNIMKGLAEAGLPSDTPAAVLARGTRAHQRHVVSTVGKLEEAMQNAGIKTPAIIVVGEVCKLEERFNWAEKRELGTLKIAITRPKESGSRLATELAKHGAEIMLMPTIETRRLEVNEQIKNTVKTISEREVIVFTSVAGVKAFFEIALPVLEQEGKDVREIKADFAVVGEATRKELSKYGLIAKYMPGVYSGRELGKLLAQELAAGEEKKTLLARGTLADGDIIEELTKAGIAFDDVAFYETVDFDRTGMISFDFDEEEVDYVAFTSASTVRGFTRLYPDIDFSKVKAVCIGQKTANAAKKYGMQVKVSEKATIDSMVELFLQQI